MPLIVVDVESDGPIPGIYSMVCFGAVIVDDYLDKTFYGQTKPISNTYQSEALKISGFSREQHLTFDDARTVMILFNSWINKYCNNYKDRPIFISDNPCYDWQFINYYFHYFAGKNPFGFSGRRIGDLFCGMKHDMRASWKHLRKTKHDHNPVNDAIGNAEAILAMKKMGLKI
jgi:hypothetical protein